jgi:hypothetical protein
MATVIPILIHIMGDIMRLITARATTGVVTIITDDAKLGDY